MPADPQAAAWLRARLAEGHEAEIDLSALGSIAEVVAYLVEVDRTEGRDDCFGAELVLTVSDLDRETLRENAAILRRLGYVGVADMMRVLACRAKPKPLPVTTRWPKKIH